MLEPVYDSYVSMARRAGGRIVPVSLQPPDWGIPRDKLEAAFSPKTKVILVNSPHNPTGTAFSWADLEAIAALCKQHDVIAICDEVYQHLIYEGLLSPPQKLIGREAIMGLQCDCQMHPQQIAVFCWLYVSLNGSSCGFAHGT